MATMQELERALVNADKAGDNESARILATEIKRQRAMNYTQPEGEPDSAATRFGRNFMRSAVVGPAQLMSRPLAAVGDLLPDGQVSNYLKSLPAAADEQSRTMEQAAERGKPRNGEWDVAGTLGSIAPAAIGGATLAIPKTVAGLAATGAATGAISGAVAPTSSENYGSQKAVDVTTGTLTGAVLSPVIAGAFKGAGQLLTSAIGKLRAFGTTPTAQQINVTIRQTLQNAGVDLSKLRPEFLKQAQAEVQAALSSGGKLDAESLTNKAAFEQAGIQGTRGQITRDPTQFQREQFLRQTQEPLAKQYSEGLAKLEGDLQGMQESIGTPLSNPDAGNRLMAPLRAYDQQLNAPVDAAYTAFKAMPESELPAIPARQAADATLRYLTSQMSLGPLPGGLVRQLRQWASSNPNQMLSPKEAESYLQLINHEIAQAKTPQQNQALEALGNQVRGWISQPAAPTAATTATQQASAAAPALQQSQLMRGLASARFAEHEANPALAAVANTVQPGLSGEQFMNQYIYGATRDNLVNLRGLLNRQDPAAWNQVRVQVLNDIRQKAAPTGADQYVNGKTLQKQIEALQKSGKYEVLFTQGERSQLQNIAKVANLIQNVPPGQSTTGLAGAAQAAGMLINLMGKIGAVAKKGSEIVMNPLEAHNALRPAPVTQAMPNLLSPNAVRGAGLIGGQLAVPAYNALSE